MSTRREIARLLLTAELIANYAYSPPPAWTIPHTRHERAEWWRG